MKVVNFQIKDAIMGPISALSVNYWPESLRIQILTSNLRIKTRGYEVHFMNCELLKSVCDNRQRTNLSRPHDAASKLWTLQNSRPLMEN